MKWREMVASKPTKVVSKAVDSPAVTPPRDSLIASTSCVPEMVCPKPPIASPRPSTVPIKPSTGVAQMNPLIRL